MINANSSILVKAFVGKLCVIEYVNVTNAYGYVRLVKLFRYVNRDLRDNFIRKVDENNVAYLIKCTEKADEL